MPYKDKKHQALSAKKHYENNKDSIKKRAIFHKINKKKLFKEYVLNYLLNHPCVDCGNSNPLVLDFDHVKGIKKYNISVLKVSGCSLETLKEEMSKCEIRCANCHRIITHKRKILKQLDTNF